MATEHLKYYIEAIWKGQGATAEAKKDIEGVGAAGEKGAKGTNAFGSAVKGVVAGGALLAIGQQALEFGKASISAASDAEEAFGKFNVVMGEFAGETEAELDKIAAATGRSKYELIDYASTIQDTFVPLGFAREEAAKMSTSITQLAIDLGSFNNIETADVIRDLQSALVGNTETLRKYGVVAQETQIKQEAMTLGLWDGKGAIDAQAKAQAILSLAYKGTTDAQGDAVRTADSYANKQRALEAATLDLKVAIGQGLVPALVAATSAAIPYVNAIAQNISVSSEWELAVKNGIISQREFEHQFSTNADIFDRNSEAYAYLIRMTEIHTAAAIEANQVAAEYRQYQEALYGALENTTAATSNYIGVSFYATEAQKRGRQSTIGYIVAKQGEEQALLDSAAAAEIQSDAYSIMSSAISSASTPIQEYYEAQTAIVDSQGEWVGAFIDNSAQIGEVSQQLAADLSSEQVKAWEEILATTAEGGAEWQAAYNALQGDLTQSQRNELIARQNDLTAASGEAISIYTGDSAAYEAAQQAKIEANSAVIMSLKETALASIESQVTAAVASGEITAAAGNAYLVGIGEGLGLLSEDEANAQLAVGDAALEMAETLNTSLDYVKEHGEATARQVGETSGAVAGEIAETWDNTEERAETARSTAAKFDAQLRGMVANKYIIEVETRYTTTGTPPPTGGSYTNQSGGVGSIPEFDTGGMVPGPVGSPQLILAHGGEQVLTQDQQRSGGGVTQNFYSYTREAQALAWAQAEQLRRQRMDAI